MVRSPSVARAHAWSSNDLLLFGLVLIWGVNFSVIKLALQELSPLAFNALRFGSATLIMLAIMALRGESLRLLPRDWLPVIGLGLFGHTFYQLLFINGIARTSPSNTSLLMATAPIFVAIYGHLLRIERGNRTVWAGILLSFSGTALLILGGRQGVRVGGTNLIGDLLVLLAAMVWAGYTTGSKPLLARYSPLKLTTLSMIAGTIPLIGISWPSVAAQDWGAVSLGAWGGLLYSSVFAVAVGYIGWYTSVQRVGNARTAVFSNLTPVVAILVAWVAVGDRLSPVQGLGAAVVLGGIMLTRRGRMR